MASDLASLLQCLHCGGAITPGLDAFQCAACGHAFAVVDEVLQVRDPDEDLSITRERQAVQAIEDTRDHLPPDATEFSFSRLLAGPCPLRTAFLSLPYDDGSAFFRSDQYFHNVAQWASAFDFIVDRLGLPGGSRVLDLGADLTWSTARLAERGWRAVGIDINHHLAAYRIFRDAGIDYSVASVDMHLPVFRDAVFDGVTAFNALHHSHRLELLIANVSRMLRPGGRLGFIEPYWYWQSARESFGVEEIEAGINENVYRLEEWHAALVNSGFELLHCSVGNAFLAVYERTRPDALRHITPEQARDEVFEPFYRSKLVLAGSDQLHLVKGGTGYLPVRIHNLSARTWSERSQVPIRLSYHLRPETPGDPAATVHPREGGRTEIGGELHPGDERVVHLRVDAPETPGRYVLDVDLLMEGVTWFAGRQQPTIRALLDVTAE